MGLRKCDMGGRWVVLKKYIANYGLTSGVSTFIENHVMRANAGK